MPVRVPSTTKVEDSAQVPCADRSVRISAGRREPATREDEEFPLGVSGAEFFN
jgi:hypothetical protein